MQVLQVRCSTPIAAENPPAPPYEKGHCERVLLWMVRHHEPDVLRHLLRHVGEELTTQKARRVGAELAVGPNVVVRHALEILSRGLPG